MSLRERRPQEMATWTLLQRGDPLQDRCVCVFLNTAMESAIKRLPKRQADDSYCVGVLLSAPAYSGKDLMTDFLRLPNAEKTWASLFACDDCVVRTLIPLGTVVAACDDIC